MPDRYPRFLCDEMLGHLARYLRAAGYDTELAAGGRPDRDLVRRAAEEGRHFLTRDRLILEHRAAAGIVCLLPPGDLDRMAGALGERFRLDWLGRAFSRCLLDNSLLLPTRPELHPHLPKDLDGRQMMRCPGCGRIYWPGSHSRRMRARLEEWQRAQPPSFGT